MRVAICFTGLFDSAINSWGYWRSNVFSALEEAGIEYDIFFHSYIQQKGFRAEIGPVNSLYNPTKYLLESNHTRHENQKVQDILSFWNSANKVCQLAIDYQNQDKKVKYDMFMRVRFDMLVKSRFDVKELIEKRTFVNMHDSCYDQGYYSDMFSMSSFEILELNSPYSFIRDCFDIYNKNPDFTSSEKLYTDYILNNKYHVEGFSKLKFDLLEKGRKIQIPQTTGLYVL